MATLALSLGCSSTSTPTPAADAAADAGAVDVSAVDAGSPDTGPCTAVTADDTPPEPTLSTPRWAFEPWISKDISTTADTDAFVNGFRERDIPVGAVVLDSPWETSYNTFTPNPSRYPGFRELVTRLHGQNIKLVLWITAFVNNRSYDLEPGGDVYTGPAANWAEGQRCNCFVNFGTTYNWWKGNGASVDFFNPTARAWWHRQQDQVLDLGVDGWKLDFGDSYVTTPQVRTAMGEVPHQRYSESYYQDFYAYGVRRRGADFVTMVRGWDESYQFAGRFFARREHAPVVWMGDNRRDWVGLADALDHTFRSAQAGYVMLGSDVGGYLDRDDRALTVEIPFDPDNFARWVAVGALSPFMQLHGRGNFTPWTVPADAEQITAIYRYWSHFHHAIAGWLYAQAQAVYARNAANPAALGSLVTPLGAGPAQWQNDYRYLLGDVFLVAPVLDATGRRNVALPEGRWFNWWAPGAEPAVGPTTLMNVDTRDRAQIPLYVREGAILPMRVAHASLNLGAPGEAATVLVWPYAAQAMTARATLNDLGLAGALSAQGAGPDVALTVPPAARGVVLGVRVVAPTRAVREGQTMLTMYTSRAALDASAGAGWYYDAAAKTVWVRLPSGAEARAITVAGAVS